MKHLSGNCSATGGLLCGDLGACGEKIPENRTKNSTVGEEFQPLFDF